MAKKILVIEDFARVRELLEIFLTKAGFVVIATDKGREGVELARIEKPDLLLIDVKLEDCDGMEVLRQVRGFDQGAQIFILSGLYAEDLEKESLASGATGFLSKGLGIDPIVQAVERALA